MEKKGKLGLVIVIVGTILGFLGFGSTDYSAEAQVIFPYQAPYISYSAKFVCGPTPAETATVESYDVVKGMYTTAINIHNPYLKDVTFWKKAVIAYPERNASRGPISNIKNESLGPDQAMYVDCKDIRSLFPIGTTVPKHIEGFLVIIVQPDAASGIMPELDVIGKYTARHRGTVTDLTSDVESIDIEKIWPTRVDH